MVITYLGHSSFKIKTASATLVTDPYDASVGFRFPKTEADIVTVSHLHHDHNNREGIKNDTAFFIDAPGEYEIKEVMIRGLQTFHDTTDGADRGKNTIFCIQSEGLSICHLGDLGQDLSEKLVKEIGAVDILMIPTGGVYTIDPSQAAKITMKLEPSIVIPMHYKVSDHAENFTQLADVDAFADKLGIEAQVMEKLTVREGGLPNEMELITLERKV